MKRIFFFALASLALASCSQDDEIIAEKSNGGSSRANNGGIAFSTYTAGQTRADDANSTAVKTLGFHVRAAYNGRYFIADDLAQIGVGYGATGQPGAGATDIFDTKTTTYYWPVDITDASKSMRFYAYNVVANNVKVNYGTAEAGKQDPWTDAAAATNQAAWVTSTAADGDELPRAATTENQLEFTVSATDAKDQLDLVVAATTADQKPADGVQPLNFVHSLAKINFSLKAADPNDNETYYVRKIELISNTGKAIATIDKTNKSDKDEDEKEHVDGIVTWAAPTFESGVAIVPSDGTIFDKEKTQAEEQAKGGKTYTYFAGTAPTTTDLEKWDDNTQGVDAGSDYSHFDATKNCVSFAGDETLKLDYNLMLFPKADKISATETDEEAADRHDVVAIRVYYMVVDASKAVGQQVIGNCGFYPTVKSQEGLATAKDNVYGCKTIALTADWLPGHAYRYTLALPKAFYTGDKDGDNIADDQNLDDETPANSKLDVDADGDNNDSEFDVPTPIRFSVTVSKWNTEEDLTEITIK